MSAAEADFYDLDLENADSLALLELDDSPWLPLYREAAGWIEEWQPIIDLGCGTGRFAALIASRGTAGYHGVDFSQNAVEEARRYVPDLSFDVQDLREWQPTEPLPGSTVFVCLETLEHLDDDCGLVAKVPPGHRVILSVPNFGSEAHVRSFTSPAQVWRRYEGLVLFRRWSYIDLAERKPGRAIHLVEAVRRSESWDSEKETA